MRIDKDRVASFLISAVITIFVIGSMIIVHEESSVFKSFLDSVTGHHWLTKSLFAAIIFPSAAIILYFAFRYPRVRRRLRANELRFWVIVLIAVTLGFLAASGIVYTYHYFGA